MFDTAGCLFLVLFAAIFLWLVEKLYWRPKRFYQRYKAKNIDGAWRPFVGGLPDIWEAIKRLDERKEQQKRLGQTVPDSVLHYVTRRDFKKYGRSYIFQLGPLLRLRTIEPDYLKDILVTNAMSSYEKGPIMQKLLGPALGEGLLLSEGEFWKKHRTMIAPAFHFKKLKPMLGLMLDITDNILDSWEEKTTIQTHEEMSGLVLDVIGSAAFGSKSLRKSKNEIFLALKNGLQETQQLMIRSPYMLLPQFHRLPIPRIRRVMGYVKTIHRSVLDLILERKQGKSKAFVEGADLLEMLLKSKYENGESLSDRQVLCESLTFALAGHETTANMLVWALYLLSVHPEVLQQCLSEIDEVLGFDDALRRPSWDELKRLEYIEAVMCETLRIFPPVPQIERIAIKDNVIGKGENALEIEKGTVISVSIFMTHRDEKYWKDPEKFDPTRFIKRHQSEHPKRHPFSYLPFSRGPRSCAGENFANLESKVILVRFLQRFNFETTAGQIIVPEAFITLRPKYGVSMDISPRHKRARGDGMCRDGHIHAVGS